MPGSIAEQDYTIARAGSHGSPMGYRLIALDIDGTIRTNEYAISERTREAVANVRAAGADVTVATGRMFRSAVRASAELELTAPIASFQGAHVADPTTGEVLWHRPLTAAQAVVALEALQPWGVDIIAYHGEEVYVDRLSPWVEGYGNRNQTKVNLLDDLRSAAGLGFTRLVVVGRDDEIKRLETEFRGRFDSTLYVTRSLPHFCEILHPSGGKEHALAWLCDYFGIRREETIAFGNGYNDIQMLEWAGLGVAIGGAVPEALAVADRVAPPIEQDGAAQVLEELLDRGLVGP